MGKLAYIALLTLLVAAWANTFVPPLKTPALCTLAKNSPEIFEKNIVPFGAQHPDEIIWRSTPESGFHAALALIQGATVTPCNTKENREATISIRMLRLIEVNPENQKEKVVAETNFGQGEGGISFDGMLYRRLPRWYPDNDGGKAPENTITKTEEKVVIDLSKHPELIYHGWTNPKVEAKEGRQYIVEAEVKISGAARLQLGVDYWREIDSVYNTFDSTCTTSNNCEAYLSSWFGPTNGEWKTIRVPGM